MAEEPKKPASTDEVLKDFSSIGKYRVRLIKARRSKAVPSLDIREYIKTETFDGFTRRGVRFVDAEQLDQLIKVLQEVKAMNPWPKKDGKE